MRRKKNFCYELLCIALIFEINNKQKKVNLVDRYAFTTLIGAWFLSGVYNLSRLQSSDGNFQLNLACFCSRILPFDIRSALYFIWYSVVGS